MTNFTITATWYDASESLPDDDLIVLIYDASLSERVWVGYRDDDEWRIADSGAVCQPTHWMPLPEGPELPEQEASTDG